MKIGIVGYGKMGHIIESIAINKKFDIITVDPLHLKADFKRLEEVPIDKDRVFIDFTAPVVIMENIKFYCNHELNAVIGTTGWYDKIEEVKKMVEESGNGLIYASNFSIGVNIFFRMIKEAAIIVNKFEEYDIGGHEFHHNQKIDSPSGTAKSITKILIDNIERKKKPVYEMMGKKINDDELHYSSSRIGSIPGTHSVIFDSSADTIELKHTARNREGFASGAVYASEWINNKKGFFTINDMLKDLFEEK